MTHYFQNSTHDLIMKIHNKRELQNIVRPFKDLLKIYRNFTSEPYSFFTIDTTLPADNPTGFRKNFSDFPL